MLPSVRKNQENSVQRRVERIQASPSWPVASAATQKAKGMLTVT